MRSSTICQLSHCGNVTHGTKPFCSEHIEEHPYVRALVAELRARDAELERVAQRGPKAVDLDGAIIGDIVHYLEENIECTAADLKRERLHYQPKEVVESYLIAMRRARMVKITRTRNGAMRVVLVSSAPKPPLKRKRRKRLPTPAIAAPKVVVEKAEPSEPPGDVPAIAC